RSGAAWGPVSPRSPRRCRHVTRSGFDGPAPADEPGASFVLRSFPPMAIPAFTRITRAAAVSLAAVALIGVAAPAASAADQSDPIAPVPDQWGRHYVDAWASNTTENTSPDTNAAIGLLSTMESYWKPEVPLTPEWDADGTF